MKNFGGTKIGMRQWRILKEIIINFKFLYYALVRIDEKTFVYLKNGGKWVGKEKKKGKQRTRN